VRKKYSMANRKPATKLRKGSRFGDLKVIRLIRKYRGRFRYLYRYLCRCVCGRLVKVPKAILKGRYTSSCGCTKAERARVRSTRHGMTGTPEWRAYRDAKGRCQCRTHAFYSYYGGRGIEFQFKSFEDFIAAVGLKPRPKSKYTLDRVNNDLGYGIYDGVCNVRWVTRTVQQFNRRPFSEWKRKAA
jgi:hypothetical protein